jgi:hypothetical protein
MPTEGLHQTSTDEHAAILWGMKESPDPERVELFGRAKQSMAQPASLDALPCDDSARRFRRFPELLIGKGWTMNGRHLRRTGVVSHGHSDSHPLHPVR